LLAGTAGAQNAGQVYTVNSTADTDDANPGDHTCADASGQCTLRAAMQEADTTVARDVIVFALSYPAVIDLTKGELVVNTAIAVVGPGARRLTLERSPTAGTPNFRIFRVPNVFPAIQLRGLKIQNGNAADQDGGAILSGGNLTLSDVTITSNTAANGGAIANTGVLVMNRCLVNSNTAAGNGGAITSNETANRVEIYESTITNNSAAVGGAIHGSSDVELINDTIVDNAATTDAQNIFNAGDNPVRTQNTIIAKTGPTTVHSLSGLFFTSGNNIITDARGSTGFTVGANNDQIGDNNSIDPLLGPLADNGGQTDSRLPLAESPAIDTGNNCVWNGTCSRPQIMFRFDQRGSALRLAGTSVDVGSVESGSNTGTVSGSLGFSPLLKRTFYYGAIAVLTDPITNQKQYQFVRPWGPITFQNVTGETFILEIHVKRSFFLSGPLIATIADAPVLSFASNSEEFNVMVHTETTTKPK